MQRAFASQGELAPRTRIGIYRWAKLNGYVAGKPVEPTFLRAHLLPRFTASVQRAGLVLHRPNTGNCVELLHGARFNNEYLAHSGLIRDALASGKIHIDVRADPDDLSQIILLDKDGAHAIPNIKDDAVLIQEGGIADLCGLNDAERLRGLGSASQRDQDGADQQAFRQDAEADAKEKQRHARTKLGTQKAPSGKARHVRAAQTQEKRDQLDYAARRAADHEPLAPTPPEGPRPAPTPPVAAVSTNPQSAASRLIDIRRNRLALFNAERKF